MEETTKVSPKVRVLNAAIEAVKSAKDIASAVKALEELKVNPIGHGGVATNVDEISVKDKDGNVVYIQDSISGLWFPVENFAKMSKGKLGYKRVHKAIDQARTKFNTSLTKEKNAVTQAWLNGEISEADAKRKIKELDAKKFDVDAVVKTLQGGLKDRPKV